jgi:hypothetical protein
MAVAALIKFTQGMTVGAPGVAFKGVAGVPVLIENISPTSIQSWKIDLVYVPLPGCSVPIATLGAANGSTPSASFTPDAVPGCYRVVMRVYPGVGFTGTPDVDIRNFALPDTNGFVYPPYQELPPKLPVLGSGLPGSKPDELNFNGQLFGWEGDGTDGLLLDFMRSLSSGAIGAENFSYKRVDVADTVTIPEKQQMIVSGGAEIYGTLNVYGELILL